MAYNGQLTGNLGRDPELKYLESGRVVANFTLAVRQGKRQGQELPARWIKVAVWGKSAEYVGNYVRRGDKVVCFGRVEPPELFTRKDGTQGLAEVFTADVIEKFSDRQEQQQGPQGGSSAAAQAAAAPAQHPAYAAAGHQPPAAAPAPPAWNSAPLAEEEDDDIPF